MNVPTSPAGQYELLQDLYMAAKSYFVCSDLKELDRESLIAAQRLGNLLVTYDTLSNGERRA